MAFLLAGASAWPSWASALGAARLDAQVASVDLWPQVRMLVASTEASGVAQILAREPEFVAPTGPRANLGIQRQPVWLRMPVVVSPDAPDRWVLSIDYPALDLIDVFLVRAGRVARQARLGDSLPVAQRSLSGRTHALEITVEPGARYDILLRVQTTSTMIVPVSLSTPARFLAHEAQVEALQGLLAGIGVCLLIYSLTLWLALRDATFACYATIVAGVTLFFLTYNGLGAEHLWAQWPWLIDSLSPLSILVALWGGFLFLDNTLHVVTLSRRVSQLMRALGWLSLAAAGAFIAGLVDYRQAQAISTALGPMPMVLGLPLAWVRMRGGDRLMAYLFAGWGVYAIGVVVMAALLRGYAPLNWWTRHAFQFGSMAEMVFWLVLLGKRVEEIRQAGHHAAHEREVLRSLAATDALTGLANRRGLEVHLPGTLARSSARHRTAVYMIDLDGFKPVNDHHGHDVGDRLLQAVAQRLRQIVRRSDFVARIGGDEFVVVAHGFDDDRAADDLGRKIMNAFEASFSLGDGVVCRIGLTIGYAVTAVPQVDPDDLIKQADSAMYTGKQAGKQCLRRAPDPSGRVARTAPASVSGAQGHPTDHLA